VSGLATMSDSCSCPASGVRTRSLSRVPGGRKEVCAHRDDTDFCPAHERGGSAHGAAVLHGNFYLTAGLAFGGSAGPNMSSRLPGTSGTPLAVTQRAGWRDGLHEEEFNVTLRTANGSTSQSTEWSTERSVGLDGDSLLVEGKLREANRQ